MSELAEPFRAKPLELEMPTEEEFLLTVKDPRWLFKGWRKDPFFKKVIEFISLYDYQGHLNWVLYNEEALSLISCLQLDLTRLRRRFLNFYRDWYEISHPVLEELSLSDNFAIANGAMSQYWDSIDGLACKIKNTAIMYSQLEFIGKRAPLDLFLPIF